MGEEESFGGIDQTVARLKGEDTQENEAGDRHIHTVATRARGFQTKTDNVVFAESEDAFLTKPQHFARGG